MVRKIIVSPIEYRTGSGASDITLLVKKFVTTGLG